MLKSANTLSDRYVLLLYWLVRKNRAKDFSCKNLEVQKKKLVPGTEKSVAEEAESEKQHIIPASVLGKAVFGGKGRLTTSRHVTNNIGNLTYISHALNHFVTGLGDTWIACGLEDGDVNLAAHFMTGPAKDTYEGLQGKTLTPEDEKLYLEFCEKRRAQIEEAFLSWLTKLRDELSAPQTRIVQEKRRANPSTADDICCLGFPAAIEDALLRLQWHSSTSRRELCDYS